MLLNILENFESYVKDPLNPETRKARKSLLVFSFVTIIIVITGLVPEKIESMGIEFSKTDQHNMLLLLGFLIIYFLISFIVYGFADLIRLKVNIIKNFKQDLKDKYEEAERELSIKEKEYPLGTYLDVGANISIIKHHVDALYKSQKGFKSFIRIRVFLDIVLPVLISVFAAILVFIK